MLHERLVAEWRRVAAAAAAVVAICAFTGLTRSLDNQIYDRAITLVQTPPSKDIVLVEIDNASFNQLGRWPWPRRVHAGLIERLAGTRPRAIDYDVLFIEPSDDDAELAAAMRKAGKAFLPSVIDRDAGPAESGLEPLAPPIQAAARATGSAELETDADGVVREACGRVAAGAKTVKQLFEIVAEEVSGEPRRAKTDCFLIPFAPSDHFLHVSFASLLKGHVPAEALRDKVVIVGINADGLGDLFAVPVGAGKLMSGMEVHANAVNALMSGRGIVPLSPWAAFVLCLLPLGILLVGYRYLNQRLGTALLVGAVLLALGASPALLAWGGIWVSPVPAIAGIIVAFMLWGWRRLSVLGSFVGDEAATLRADLSSPTPSEATWRGDVLSGEANQLHGLIDQLRRLRAFIAEIIRFQPDALCVIDEHGIVNLGNDAARQLYGAEVENVPFDDVMAGIGHGGTREGRLLTRPDGRVLMISEAALSEARRVVRLADVTELQRAAAEREELLQFLSHDLRSPNAGIVTLLDKHALGSEATEAPKLLEQIRAYARHALNLADDFVRLARVRAQRLRLDPVDMCDVVQEAVDMVWAKASDRGISLDNKRPGQLGLWVMGDRGMLVRAAINLLDNAVKFAPEGARVCYGVETDGKEVRLSVSGPSPEMPPARAANPFAVFADGRDTDGGASVGLGLAFVESAATRHGGHATFGYVPGYGATFTIAIPAAPIEEPLA